MGPSVVHKAFPIPSRHRAVTHSQGVTRWPRSPSAEGSPGALAFLTPLRTLCLPGNVPRAALPAHFCLPNPSPSRTLLAAKTLVCWNCPFHRAGAAHPHHACGLHPAGGPGSVTSCLSLDPGSLLGLTPQARVGDPPGHPALERLSPLVLALRRHPELLARWGRRLWPGPGLPCFPAQLPLSQRADVPEHLLGTLPRGKGSRSSRTAIRFFISAAGMSSLVVETAGEVRSGVGRRGGERVPPYPRPGCWCSGIWPDVAQGSALGLQPCPPGCPRPPTYSSSCRCQAAGPQLAGVTRTVFSCDGPEVSTLLPTCGPSWLLRV